MKKLYVGNLSYNVTADDLSKLFSKFGQLGSANLIKDKLSGNSKGFAFVEMLKESDADAAIQGLNGTEYEGRNLKVSEAVDLNKVPGRSMNQRYDRRG